MKSPIIILAIFALVISMGVPTEAYAVTIVPAGNIDDGDPNTKLNGANSVAVDGNFAYVTSGTSDALQIINISDKDNPVAVGNIDDGDPNTKLNGANSVAVDGNFAYVVSQFSGALQIIDITDKENPTAAGNISNSDPKTKLNGAISVVVDGNFAYVASINSDALQIIDITDKENPTAAGNISNSDPKTKLNGANSVAVDGNFAYVTSLNDGALQILQLTDDLNVVITSDQQGKTLPSNTPITFTATAIDGTTDVSDKIEWYLTGKPNNVLGTGASFTFTFHGINDNQSITASYRINGNTFTDTVTFTTSLSFVDITTPDDSSTHTQGDNITFTGVAYKKGVVKSDEIEWLSNGNPIGTGATITSNSFAVGDHTVIAKYIVNPTTRFTDSVTFTVTASTYVAPEIKKSGSSGDTTPPTMGLDKSGFRIINNGFSFNGIPVNVDQFHTEYPLIQTTVGVSNTLEAIIYENGGVNNIKWLQVGLGMPEIGSPLNDAEGIILIEFVQNGIEVDTISYDDPNNLINKDTVTVTTTEVNCNDSTLKCVLVTISYTFNEAPTHNVIVLNPVDYKRNSINYYFNDGIDVIGDSLNPPPTDTVAVSKAGSLYPLKRGTIDLVQIDKDNGLWADELGYIWIKTVNGYALESVIEYTPRTWEKPGSHGFDRNNPYFTEYRKAMLSEITEKYGIDYTSVLPQSVEMSYTTTDKRTTESFELEITHQVQLAEQKLAQLNAQWYSSDYK